MKTLHFECKLLSDVILNQKSASEGPNTTLDFIPGSNFLGIVAAKVYPDSSIDNSMKMELFHSGKVRFGDAHPSKNDVRGLRIPAAIFHPKLKKVSEEAYIHHGIEDPSAEEYRNMQLKQCRLGFYVYNGEEATLIATENNYAIKSARDKENRKSQDEQMFGYQSLAAGLGLIFSVEVDNEELAKTIAGALVGKKKVGRSRSAQYGLVEISECEKTPAGIPTAQKKGEVTVYADGRLIFLDEDGMPTLQPTAEQLGITGGTILWDKCQVRTFCYAPYNYQRRCFDTDRCGIEKGSVFVVKTDADLPATSYIGSYNNEGFGAVIYNPSFLMAKEDGQSVVKYKEAEKIQNTKEPVTEPSTSLISFLKRQKSKNDIEEEVYPEVNKWVRENKGRFNEAIFASQWGHIRSLAMIHRKKNSLEHEINEYLGHGVAKDKWEKRGRKKALVEFLGKLKDENASITIVNLAAEMAKICRRKEDKK